MAMMNLDDTIRAFRCCIQIPPDCANCPEQGPGFGFACKNDLKLSVFRWLNAQEPRILTADEMKSWNKDVWIEDFDEDKVIALDESVAGFAVACMRGKKRCWTARPTEEQRKAVPWE